MPSEFSGGSAISSLALVYSPSHPPEEHGMKKFPIGISSLVSSNEVSQVSLSKHPNTQHLETQKSKLQKHPIPPAQAAIHCFLQDIINF